MRNQYVDPIENYIGFRSSSALPLAQSESCSCLSFRRVRPKVRKHSGRAVEWNLSCTDADQPRGKSSAVRLHVPGRAASTRRTDFHLVRPSGKTTRVSLYYLISIVSSSRNRMQRVVMLIIARLLIIHVAVLSMVGNRRRDIRLYIITEYRLLYN